MSWIDARERLIVALDLPDVETASAMVRELREVTGFFKVGLSLQLAIGVEVLIQSLLDGSMRFTQGRTPSTERSDGL